MGGTLGSMRINIRQIMLAALFLVIACHTAFAKAYYAGKAEMIQKAEVIVMVDITKVVDVQKQGKAWRYSQCATGQVKQTLKGAVTGPIEIYGMESFICARCEYKTGRFLLFLKKGDEAFWHGANWHLGIRPIKNDKVAWFKDQKARFEMTAQPLADVVKDIESILKQKAPDRPSEATR
jgi:hypothetical protein